MPDNKTSSPTPDTPVKASKSTESQESVDLDSAPTAEKKASKPKKTKEKSPTKDEQITAKDAEIVRLTAEVNALKDQLLREQAELVNFKRRITDEKIKDRKFANADLFKTLLPVVDHLEAALKVEGQKEDFQAFYPNFKKLHENFLTALKDGGLEPVEAEGTPFDPTVHEAVMQEAKDGVEAGVVIEEFQKGYRYHDRILRPSMVKVSE